MYRLIVNGVTCQQSVDISVANLTLDS